MDQRDDYADAEPEPIDRPVLLFLPLLLLPLIGAVIERLARITWG